VYLPAIAGIKENVLFFILLSFVLEEQRPRRRLRNSLRINYMLLHSLFRAYFLVDGRKVASNHDSYSSLPDGSAHLV